MTTTLPLFTASPSCRGGRLCGPCRQRTAGRALRESLAAAYQLPAEAPDFGCPHGKPWAVEAVPLTLSVVARGAVGIAKAVTGIGSATAETVAARTTICAACPNAVIVGGAFRQCSICKCATWAKVRNANEACPDVPPRWVAGT